MEKDGKEKVLDNIMKMLGLGTKEEAIAKGISDLTDVEKIEMLSNLYPLEDEELAIVSLIANRYNIQFLKDYVNARLKLRCSVMGWRANQIVAIASEKRREEARFGFLRRIFGKGKEKMGVEEFE
ncbi:MAG: hypothetical protein QXI91_06545 [Candidatus Bathyarchaeia archaeon]